MSPILELLQQMRGRLAMIVGQQCLTRFIFFIEGYEHALFDRKESSQGFSLQEFRHWVYAHYGYREPPLYWDEMILHHTKSQAEAIEQFWQLLDTYLAERGITLEPVTRRRPTNGVNPTSLSHELEQQT